MKQYLQTTLLGLSILLILSSLVANADTSKPKTSEVKYVYFYHASGYSEYTYRRFLPTPKPEGLNYDTRMSATANVDDTPEKENIILMVAEPENNGPSVECVQAFLLIGEIEEGGPQKKDFFKIFDTGTHQLDVQAKTIEHHSPPIGFKQTTNVSFRLADLTGDGILDIWVETADGVALISFQNGEFKEVLSNYTVTREKLAEAFDIDYHHFEVPFEPQGEKYHRFLATPPPEGLYYNTQMTATANVDDTPEKENIVLIVVETGVNGPGGEWVRAFLLIAESEADVLKKKDLFKLFETGWHPSEVPAKPIDLQSPPFLFREVTSSRPWSGSVSFELVDVTGDGTLDVWVESSDGVAVISFQNDAFKAVCSVHSSFKRKDPIEYIDLDNDGTYEIKIPTRISMDGVPTAAYPEWMSFYEWDGTTYVLNNERFYAENDAFLIRLLDRYNTWPRYDGREAYSFYIGLIYYYRGNVPMAQKYLQWVVKNAKKNDYIQAAESLLKKLPPH